VDHLKLRIDEHNAAWQAYFERCGIEPLKVVYEEFIEAYAESVLGLLEGIGISIPEDFTVARPKMKQQADETSEEWVRVYNDRKAAESSGRV
jgi:LPS sulfotransferase NodH